MPDQTALQRDQEPVTETTADGAEAQSEVGKEPVDQYDPLLRALEEGTLLSINNEARSALPTDELKVTSSRPFKTSVRLIQSGFDETYYKIYRADNGELVYGEVTNDGVTREDSVVTLEILGIDNS